MYVLKRKLKNGTRVGKLYTPHGMISAPFFMPVGTVGSVKAMMPAELRAMGAEIILSNTYHLYLRPGEKNIKSLGGLHKFMNWDGPILTDSGGYQVFSLARGNNYSKNTVIPAQAGIQANQTQQNNFLDPGSQATGRDDTLKSMVKITDDGVEFRSHLDGSKHFFTPEKVIDIQLDLGVDILMPLDVCPSGKATREEVEEAVRLTTEWARRAKAHFDKKVASTEYRVPSKRPLLHGIIQGGLYEDLRRKSASELIELDFDGYSVGGLAVDFETRDMWNIVKLMGEILPEDKQRYLMGVGTPDDIIKATRLGMDMFDCVLPTRLARRGSVYIKNQKQKTKNDSEYELINLLKSEYRLDDKPIDENCGCEACRGNFWSRGNSEISPKINAKADGGGFSRAYISHLLRCNEILGHRLTTTHNLWTYLNLMCELRTEK